MNYTTFSANMATLDK